MTGCVWYSCMDAWKKYHKTACTSLPKDEHLDVHPQEDLYMQFYGIFSYIHISSLFDGRMCLVLLYGCMEEIP